MGYVRAAFPGVLLLIVWIAPLRAQFDLSGSPLIHQALARLNVTGSVLMIAAHPDDENNPLLAYLSRGRRLRTAYLSATRGEGGQNLIGSEQGELLGIIRTQELLAARSVDGAGQFFTRAVDFGFSKSPRETLEKWGREQILGDMVQVIRRFRPDVIVLTFSGTPRDGHGHHQASAILGREAFTAAADPARYREQLRYVQPWRAKRVVQSLYGFRGERPEGQVEPARLQIDAGEYDPVLGRSYAEIGAISRSMHRCQAEGSAQRRGSLPMFLLPVAGEPASKDLMEGVDLSWRRIPGGEPVGKLLSEAAAAFEPAHPDKIVPVLAKARVLLAAISDPLARDKLEELDETIALCAGLWVDAQAERYEAVPGSEVGVSVSLLNRSRLPVRVEKAIVEGMWNEPLRAPDGDLPYNRVSRIEFRKRAPENQPWSQPYWLAGPRIGDRYQVEDPKLIGLPESPAVARVRVRLRVESAAIDLVRPVHHRYVDRALGERARPLAIVPPVAVMLPQDAVLFPNGRPRRVQVVARAAVAEAAGAVRVKAPAGWKVEPLSREFRIASAGEQQELWFDVTPPAGESAGELRALAAFRGRDIASGIRTITYPHFPPQTIFPPATGKLVRANVKVAARRVGYVMGAGDEVPEALRQIGCEVTLLSRSDLEQRNLSEFDAIVAGVRAYNVRSDLIANQPRLMDYVQAGGTYIVQYNRLDSLPPIGPYPLTIGNLRVSVEDSPVAFLNPDHPVLVGPNRITPRDFEGWVQERGLYFASQWDPRYQTPLQTHDPGEKPLSGGLLYLPYGKGVFIYTAYSWFRELPAGVPGAYRIFANLLSAKGR